MIHLTHPGAESGNPWDMELSTLTVIAILLVGLMLLAAASWLVRVATAQIATELTDTDPELSRVRPKPTL